MSWIIFSAKFTFKSFPKHFIGPMSHSWQKWHSGVCPIEQGYCFCQFWINSKCAIPLVENLAQGSILAEMSHQSPYRTGVLFLPILDQFKMWHNWQKMVSANFGCLYHFLAEIVHQSPYRVGVLFLPILAQCSIFSRNGTLLCLLFLAQCSIFGRNGTGNNIIIDGENSWLICIRYTQISWIKDVHCFHRLWSLQMP